MIITYDVHGSCAYDVYKDDDNIHIHLHRNGLLKNNNKL